MSKVLLTNEEAVAAYAKEPTEENFKVLKRHIAFNSGIVPSGEKEGDMRTPIGGWGLDGATGVLKLMVDAGMVPTQEIIDGVIAGWYEADWRRRAYLRSPEAQKRFAERANGGK